MRVPGAGYTSQTWSPNGRTIAFGDNSTDSNFNTGGIYLVGRDGKGLRKIPGTSNLDNSPAWSPDGNWIAFAVDGQGIYVMRRDGSDRRQLTTEPEDRTPVWSPDGRVIAFSRTDENYNENVWAMNSDGSEPHALTHFEETPGGGPAGGTTPAHAIEPTWSPKGLRIAFALYPNDQGQLWVINADGSKQRPVRRGIQLGGDLQPSWRP